MPITLREKQLLEFWSQGLTYAEIGKRLGKSVPTLKLDARLLLVRLGAKDRIQAVAIALRSKLIN